MNEHLSALGWSAELERTYLPLSREGDVLARVIAVHRNRLQVHDGTAELSVTLASHFRESTTLDRPATGDWVVLEVDRVRAVLPRRSAFVRRAAGEKTEAQVVAANVDRVLVVAGLPDDLNARRLERYLAVAWESGAIPTIVLTKADLVVDATAYVESVRAGAPGVDVIAVSVIDGRGMSDIEALLAPGATVALLGSSGVGKSTLLNHLAGREQMQTGEVRDDGKGRHTTTHRELVALPGGALVIDTPGMRELQLWSVESGIEHTFDDIAQLAGSCRFGDCRHAAEPECAVRAAIEEGTLDVERLESWRKLSREAQRAQRTALEAGAELAKAKSLQKLLRTRLQEKYD